MLLLDELEEDGTLEAELDGALEELLEELLLLDELELLEEELLLEELEEDELLLEELLELELLLDELELLLEDELLEVSLEVELSVDVDDSVESTLLVDVSSLEEDSVSELVGGSVLYVYGSLVFPNNGIKNSHELNVSIAVNINPNTNNLLFFIT